MIPESEAIKFASKYGPEAMDKAESLAKEIAHEFGLTKEEDFVGLYELLILLYEPAKIAYNTLKALNYALQQMAIWFGGDPSVTAGFALAPVVMP